MRRAAIAGLFISLLSFPHGSVAVTPPRQFTLAVAGDVLIHEQVADIANRNLPGAGFDFRPMLAEIEPWVSAADLSICHLEVTLSPDDTALSYYPRFRAPFEIADALRWAGWDGCSVASNHALDRGWPGIVDTLDVLDRAGLGHAGTARSPAERLPTLYEVNGVTVAHISVTEGTNWKPLPEGYPWSVNVLDIDRLHADAAWARSRGAEFVLVSIHWGEQYVVGPINRQEEQAARIMESPDIDLVVGHHAHVVQPIGRVAGRYVVYGLGNHLSNQNGLWGDEYFGTEDGLLVTAHVVETGGGRFTVDRLEVTPTMVRVDDLVVLPATDPPPVTQRVADFLAISAARTLDRVARLGAGGVEQSPVPNPTVYCGSRRATILGTEGPDQIQGTPGDDVIVTRGGSDVVLAAGGDDTICAGDGDDLVVGGSGRDRLFGGPGDDILLGDGDDIVSGDRGDDRCGRRAPITDCER
jgi:poly-gamma-glutamate capsule biosynthesis protein CapA/YwtB (metallophosphatase superfamily)